MSPETIRTAACRCGHLTATCTGEPVRVSVCHCFDCQKRTGSAFSAQARWPEAQVQVEGRSRTWSHFGDSGNRIVHHFCPDCGSTVHYRIDGKFDGLVAIPLGAFADPRFPAPKFSVWEERKHDWVAILGDDVEHMSWGRTTLSYRRPNVHHDRMTHFRHCERSEAIQPGATGLLRRFAPRNDGRRATRLHENIAQPSTSSTSLSEISYRGH